jgi:hypothetical protein
MHHTAELLEILCLSVFAAIVLGVLLHWARKK